MKILNNKGLVPAVILVIILAIVFLIILLPAVLFAGEQGYDTEGGDCTSAEGVLQYSGVTMTRYGPDCPGCTGILKAKDSYFQKKINNKTVYYKNVNVKSGQSNYAPSKWPDVFREVATDQLLKPTNRIPALIEFNDDDYGWVKIVAMKESSKGVSPVEGYESGSVLKVTLPSDKFQPFLVIIGDTGNLAKNTSLDLLTMKNNVQWFNTVFSPDYRTESNITVDVLRIGYQGEASDNINCTDASDEFMGDDPEGDFPDTDSGDGIGSDRGRIDRASSRQPSIAAYMRAFGSSASEVRRQLVNVTFYFGVNRKTVLIHKKACGRFMSAIADANILRGSDTYKIKSIGTYAWRGIVSKGGTCTKSNCSRHSFGVAFDINAYAPNGYGPNAKSDIPRWMITAFAKYGIYWGGNWSPTYNDPMHFQVNNLAPYQGPACR